jgi:hypothetical protein
LSKTRLEGQGYPLRCTPCCPLRQRGTQVLRLSGRPRPDGTHQAPNVSHTKGGGVQDHGLYYIFSVQNADSITAYWPHDNQHNAILLNDTQQDNVQHNIK